MREKCARSEKARPRALGAALLALGLGAAALVPACDTGAVGIDACRAIETARCDAAPTCEGDDPSFGIATETQIRNCKTFYNDQCLVGLENTEAEPSQDAVDDCVAAIVAIAACQVAGVGVMSECEGVVMKETFEQLSPCEALERPERVADCFFIQKVDDD